MLTFIVVKEAMTDIVFLIILLIAVIQGWRRGLILAIFSVICLLLGLAAAVKLSAVVATYLGSDLQVSSRWLPVIAFVVVFLVVAILVRWLAGLLEKLIKLVLLGWLNKLGGMILYILLYISVYSVILFYGTRAQIISPEAIASSRVYPWIAPWGPAVIHFIQRFIPFGQDMFAVLETFFARIAERIN
jgi:membrane protein required for colicin V production